MENWGRILIGTRLEKMVSSHFLQVWERIITRGLRQGDACYSVRGMVAHQASNELVRVLLASECDSLLFLDSDAVVEHDIISQFANYEDGYRYDILQAFYCRRGWPPSPIWLKTNARGQMSEWFVMQENFHEPLSVGGTHCCIMRRKVFERILGDNDPDKFDWFYYPRGEFVSEDSAFSGVALEHGFSIGGTTAISAGHLGELETNWATYKDYLIKTGRVPLLLRYKKLAGMIAEFLGEPPDLIMADAMNSEHSLAERWHEIDHSDADAVKAFYASREYLGDLLYWNIQPMFERLISPLSRVHGKKALVIGAGIGTECASLLKAGNQVDAFELPGYLRDFLQYRFGDDVTFVDWPIEGKYDVVSLIDVVEHVHPSEIDSFLDIVDKALAPGGILVAHYTAMRNDTHPQHYDHDERWVNWVSQYKRVGESEWVKS